MVTCTASLCTSLSMTARPMNSVPPRTSTDGLICALKTKKRLRAAMAWLVVALVAIAALGASGATEVALMLPPARFA